MSASDRLSMLDEYGGKKQIIPAEARGRFRRLRTVVYWILLVVFLALPWLKINGLQAVLLDIPNRHFEIFGTIFLAHDTPLIFFIAAISVLAIALSTAIWGRVWCGWACPQTVFIDAIYRRIEILVEGDYVARRRRQAAEMSFDKALRMALKWTLYFLVSSLFAHSLIAYFSGADRLIQMIQNPPESNWTYFVLVGFVTALLMFNFGWFREQFCIIMCPYGRFQSVLMDQHSLNIVYDSGRGEPRRGLVSALPQGDCVSCNRCVQVCPTGIDIRNGSQLECIGCTACIDACDEIMVKINKPTGLISYRSVSGERGKAFRPRVLVYSFLIVLCAGVLTYNLATRLKYSITMLRAKDTPYQIMQDNEIMNHFKAHLVNQSNSSQSIVVTLSSEMQAAGAKLAQVQSQGPLRPQESRELHLFVTFPRTLLNSRGETRIKFDVVEQMSGDKRSLDMVAVGPYSSGS